MMGVTIRDAIEGKDLVLRMKKGKDGIISIWIDRRGRGNKSEIFHLAEEKFSLMLRVMRKEGKAKG